jgi:two-component system response regulator HydG
VVNVVRKAWQLKQVLDRNRRLERLMRRAPGEEPASDGRPLSDLPYVEAKRRAVGAFNRSYLEDLLAKAHGNVTAAASLAKLDRSNFRRLLKQFAVPRPPREVVARDEDGALEVA